MSTDPLTQIIDSGLEHRIHKWLHYLPLYHRYFDKYRNIGRKISILEIGVQNGGSLDMWNKYFGPDNCDIYGVDIDPKCAQLQRDNIKIFIGDQGDSNFLNSLKEKIPQLDIIIDDGGHTMKQQILTFQLLFSHVKPDGIYLCEDTHTSYWSAFGGKLKDPSTFIEYSKNCIDDINGYHYGHVNNITQTCSGIHYHDSMVFFEKSPDIIPAPRDKAWEYKRIIPE